jgi:hypothetical protein
MRGQVSLQGLELQTELEPQPGRLLARTRLAKISLLAFTMQPVRKKDAPRIARPAVRYWKGKAPKGVAEAQDSDSDAEAPQNAEPTDVPIHDLNGGENDEDDEDDESVVPRRKVPKSMNVALRNVNISKEGKVIVDGKEESGRTIVEQGALHLTFW